MAITTEQVQAASLAALGFCTRHGYNWTGNEAAMREALEAAERVAPIAAPKAFAVTDELVAIAEEGYDTFQPRRYEPCDVGPLRAALKAVSAELGKQQAQEQPAGETEPIDDEFPDAGPEPERMVRPFELSEGEQYAAEAAVCGDCSMNEQNLLAQALDRALSTLGPTEREKELERKLLQAQRDISEWIDRETQRLAEIAQLRTDLEQSVEREKKWAKQRDEALDELAQLRAKLAECERARGADMLTADERAWRKRMSDEKLGALGHSYGQIALDIVDACEIIDRLAPEPAPVDPVQQVLAEMRVESADWAECSHQRMCVSEWIVELERALAQKEQKR